jgi:hypothetical protein
MAGVKVTFQAPVINYNAMAPVIKEAMMEETRDVERRYGEFFQTWDQKPKITSKWITIQPKRFNFIRSTEPTGNEGLIQIIRWLIYGTEPHIIEPRGDYPMRWVGSRGSYRAKTDPGVISSHAGGTANNVPVAAMLVEHPGITPRGTIAMINQERITRLGIRFRGATERAIYLSIRSARKR